MSATIREDAICFTIGVLRYAKDWQEGQHALADHDRFGPWLQAFGDEIIEAQSIIARPRLASAPTCRTERHDMAKRRLQVPNADRLAYLAAVVAIEIPLGRGGPQRHTSLVTLSTRFALRSMKHDGHGAPPMQRAFG
jgi:hypothetical protein